MRRTTVIAVAATAALALVGAFGALNASASTLCSVKQATCPTGSQYGVGTEITATLRPGTQVTFGGGTLASQCSESTWKGKVTNAGGSKTPVEAEVTSISFLGCDEPFTSMDLLTSEHLTLSSVPGTNWGTGWESGGLVRQIKNEKACYWRAQTNHEAESNYVILGAAQGLYVHVAYSTLGYGCADMNMNAEYVIQSPSAIWVEGP